MRLVEAETEGIQGMNVNALGKTRFTAHEAF
jgi:hypothetical protein